MNRIIINFDPSTSPQEALFMVLSIVNKGRISESRFGPCYCLASQNRKHVAYADITSNGTDTFKIQKLPQTEDAPEEVGKTDAEVPDQAGE